MERFLRLERFLGLLLWARIFVEPYDNRFFYYKEFQVVLLEELFNVLFPRNKAPFKSFYESVEYINILKGSLAWAFRESLKRSVVCLEVCLSEKVPNKDSQSI